MFVLVGLGNPGPKYSNTRHNVGFWVLDELAVKAGVSGFDWKEKYNCLFAKTQLGNEPVLLAKPQSYMNLSGEALFPLLSFYKADQEKLVVIHDELDLAPGDIRLRRGGSSAGHLGVQNIIDQIGHKNFFRIRVGVGHPTKAAAGTGNKEPNQVDRGARGQSVSSWVLAEPGPKEKELLEKAVLRAADAAQTLMQRGLETAQQRFHKRS